MDLFIEEATMMFWMSQCQKPGMFEYMKEKSDNGLYPYDVMVLFDKWYNHFRQPQNIRIWARGFDLRILSQYYGRFGMKQPWNFREMRCVRTYCMDYPGIEKEITRDGIEHTGIGDCIHQIKYLQLAHRRKSKLKKPITA